MVSPPNSPPLRLASPERSKLWDDLKTAWTDPRSASSSSFMQSSTDNGGPILHKSHASVQARNRSNSGSSEGSKKKKKGKGKGTPGSYKISRKALKTANRLHNHAATIQKRHEHRKTNIETAEKEYLEMNQFSTSKKTRQMAGRRSTFMVNNFSPEMMHQLTVLASSNDTSNQDEHVSNVLNDVGSRLHLEAEIKKQKLTKMAELSTFEKQEEEMRGCTFQPELNTHSQTMLKGRGAKDVFKSLYDQNVEVQNKKAYYDEIAEINSDCTFKPKINVISKEMAELLEISPDPTSPVPQNEPKWKKLYEERFKKAERIEQIKVRTGYRNRSIADCSASRNAPHSIYTPQCPHSTTQPFPRLASLVAECPPHN